MGSRWQRYLSLLLVMVISTSWLMVPKLVLARDPVPSDIVIEEGADTAAGPTSTGSAGGTNSSSGATGTRIGTSGTTSEDDTVTEQVFTDPCGKNAPAGESIQNVLGSTGNQPSLPPYFNRCFILGSDGTINHRFRYDYNQTVQASETLFEVKYEQVLKDVPIFGGCDTGVTSTCDKTRLRTLNHFSFYTTGVRYSGGEFSPVTAGAGLASTQGAGTIKIKHETYSDVPIKAYRPIGLSTLNSNIYLLASNHYIYGFFEINNERFQAMKAVSDKAKYRQDHIGDKKHDFILVSPEGSPGSYRNKRPIEHYIGSVNGLYNPKARPYWLIRHDGSFEKLNDQDRSESTRQAVQELFGGVNSDHITLEDDEAHASASSMTLSPPAPDTSPILHISGSGTNLPFNLTFKLRYALTVSANYPNNYFGFILEQPFLTDDIKEALIIRGLDPAFLYVMVDLAGNVAFLVEDTTKNNGIFEGGKSRIDDFVVVGAFHGTDREASENNASQLLNVNLGQYEAKITRRVYNEIDTNETGGDCGNIIEYPNLNTTYANIPGEKHRKCINVSPGGWLDKWDVQYTKLDREKNDCVNTFGGNPATKFFAGFFCFFLNMVINSALWFANFSVNFLIESVGLQ